jgi:hypothetical protein
VQIVTDGKEPDLAPFTGAILDVVGRACRKAHHAMERPAGSWTVKAAAYHVMKDAYMSASAGGTLPVRPRQIMYAARLLIDELTDRIELKAHNFTQRLLPNYMKEHPDETRDWNVIWDARGTFVEPHTEHQVPIGTAEVRQYADEQPELAPAIKIAAEVLYPTRGPQHRYDTVLFIEKEGFEPLLQATQLRERFDIGAMSTKGMSTTSARLVLDLLSAKGVRQVLVAHDFDYSGFSIFGTLGTNSRRYTFRNKINVIDKVATNTPHCLPCPGTTKIRPRGKPATEQTGNEGPLTETASAIDTKYRESDSSLFPSGPHTHPGPP